MGALENFAILAMGLVLILILSMVGHRTSSETLARWCLGAIVLIILGLCYYGRFV